MRAPPSGPCEQDWMATGLPSKGCSFIREAQSIAFFSPPGIDQLYSGVTNRTPSAARTAVARSCAGPGKPEASCMSALYSGSVSKAGAVINFIPGGARPGNARVKAALYDPLRSDPQMTSTLNWSAILFLLLLRLFRFEAGRFRDLLECFDVGLNNFDELRGCRQFGKRAYAFKALLDRIF